MNIKDFNEALYASSNGVVVERRKNPIIPIIILLAGVALLVANTFVPSVIEYNNIKSVLVLAGGLITLVGVAYCAVNLFGRGVPYHKGEKCALVQRQYSFDRAQLQKVVSAVEKCDKIALDAIDESDIAGVSVICCYSPNGNYCVMQAFTYEDFVYQSITKLYEKA